MTDQKKPLLQGTNLVKRSKDEQGDKMLLYVCSFIFLSPFVKLRTIRVMCRRLLRMIRLSFHLVIRIISLTFNTSKIIPLLSSFPAFSIISLFHILSSNPPIFFFTFIFQYSFFYLHLVHSPLPQTPTFSCTS